VLHVNAPSHALNLHSPYSFLEVNKKMFIQMSFSSQISMNVLLTLAHLEVFVPTVQDRIVVRVPLVSCITLVLEDVPVSISFTLIQLTAAMLS
jgi:hypothetical protein